MELDFQQGFGREREGKYLVNRPLPSLKKRKKKKKESWISLPTPRNLPYQVLVDSVMIPTAVSDLWFVEGQDVAKHHTSIFLDV